jgi:hypothetical protein
LPGASQEIVWVIAAWSVENKLRHPALPQRIALRPATFKNAEQAQEVRPMV